MIWRDSRGRFIRVPKTAIAAVALAVFPTSKVGKYWRPADTLDDAVRAYSDVVGGTRADSADGYRSTLVLPGPVSMDWLADALEYRSAAIERLDLGGARLHVLVRLVNGKHVPITKAYDKTDEILAQSVYELRNGLQRYMPDDAEDDDSEDMPAELPPEPIRYNKRDARGRFTK